MTTKYQRKTRDLWDILANYGQGQGWEVVTCATSLKEKRELMKEYLDNEKVPLKSRKYREKI